MVGGGGDQTDALDSLQSVLLMGMVVNRGEEGRLGRDHWDRVLMECPRAHGYLTIGTGIVGVGRGARMVMIDKGFGRRLL